MSIINVRIIIAYQYDLISAGTSYLYFLFMLALFSRLIIPGFHRPVARHWAFF